MAVSQEVQEGGVGMRHILQIGHNDVRILLKWKTAYIWLFVMPLVFIYFMGLANRGPAAPFNHRPSVLIENQDSGFMGKILVDQLGAQGIDRLDPNKGRSAARGIRIPPGLTSKVLDHQHINVEFFRRSDSAEADAFMIELRLIRALIAINSHIIEVVADPNDPLPITEARLRAVMAGPDLVRLDTRFAGRRPVPSGFNFSLPGTLVMYLMMNLLVFGGASVSAQRGNGIIRRLCAGPVTRLELIMGKIYGLMLLGTVQIAFLIIVGRLLFHVNLGSNLPGVAVTLLIFAWVAGSLGVFVGSVFATEERVVAVCVLTALAMAALGGCWWPLELAPAPLGRMAMVVPTGWAMAALHQLISMGNGIATVWRHLLILSAYGVAANLIAARYFRA